jgi:hypothetical protein
LPGAHSLLVEQLVRHDVPVHAYAPQLLVVVLHAPAPSHAPARVSIASEHASVPHAVDVLG